MYRRMRNCKQQFVVGILPLHDQGLGVRLGVGVGVRVGVRVTVGVRVGVRSISR
jgi:hypothetical protein